jgi:hypothetical protein
VKTWLDPDRRAVRQAAIGLATLWVSLGSGPPRAAMATLAERPAQDLLATPDRAVPQTTGAASNHPAAPTPPTPPSARTPPGTSPEASASGQCGPEAGPGRGLKEADLDGNGKISRTEFMHFHELRFERMPKDRNGLVSVEDAMRQGGMMMPGGPVGPGGAMGPGGAQRPAPPSPPASSPRTPGGSATPDPGSRPSGSSSPDGEPDRGPPPPPDGAAASSGSSPSSTPSSSAPQEAKPGR